MVWSSLKILNREQLGTPVEVGMSASVEIRPKDFLQLSESRQPREVEPTRHRNFLEDLLARLADVGVRSVEKIIVVSALVFRMSFPRSERGAFKLQLQGGISGSHKSESSV